MPEITEEDATLMVAQDARLVAVADRLDELAQDAHRMAGMSGGVDLNGESLGGWINNPFCRRLDRLCVDLRDEIAAIPLSAASECTGSPASGAGS